MSLTISKRNSNFPQSLGTRIHSFHMKPCSAVHFGMQKRSQNGAGEGSVDTEITYCCFTRLALTQQRAQGLADLGYALGQLFHKEGTLDCLDIISKAEA